jgi:hypothetical protein
MIQKEDIKMNYKRKTIEHCEQNKNLLTNFKKENMPLYDEAIRRYGKGDVFITDEAYWENGRKDESMCALRCTIDKDYSEFWRVFEMVKKAYDNKIFNALMRASMPFSGID